MNYFSVFSGIEAVTTAWHELGFNPIGFSEIEPFPCAVLAHHYPNVTNYGDITKYEQWSIEQPIDVFVGGSPCQAFSVAGLRKGFDDDRGNLTLTYLRAISHFKPRWVVWENVPGVLSHDGGRTFGVFLGALAELGYGFAYRVLDAQYFGVPQRRRRVFLVGYLGDWRKATQVLFESESLCRNLESSSKEKKEITRVTENSFGNSSKAFRKGGYGEFVEDKSIGPLCNRDHKDTTGIILQGFAVTEHTVSEKTMSITASYGQGGADLATKPIVIQKKINKISVVHGTQDPCVSDKAFSLGRNNGAENTVFGAIVEKTGTLTCGHGERGVCFDSIASGICALHGEIPTPRKLTPIECERLQGFPDDYTNIQFKGKPVTDNHRYKALGNSMAVPVMRWIGERIKAVGDEK